MNPIIKRAADWAHEASVLVGVFAMLDRIVRGDLTWSWTIAAVAVSAIFFVGSAALDRYSK